MNKYIRHLLVSMFCMAMSASSLSAQYYDWGQNPASIKWMQIKTENGRFVFPDSYTANAVRLMRYMDTVRPQINYGFRYGPMNIPVVMHTQNFSQNGLVMLAPKRMELIVPPPTATAAMPWLKQLSVHEFRHSVQFSNANRGVVKALSYILGQQGSLVGVAFFPYWAMEGDAVLAETQFASFGRGLQPSFTIDYRAMALEGEKKYAIDKYFCGSFKDNMPDHYHLGYQLTSWAYTRHGSDYWSKVVGYGVRRPYVIFGAKVAQRKYFGSSTNKLFKGAFEDLNSYWRSLPAEENSAEVIATPTTSFTTYSTPVAINDSTLVAVKTDFDRSSRIVMVGLNTGKEKVLHRTGAINTGLSYMGGMLWWSELRQSTFWEQRVNSRVCWYNMDTGRSGVVRDSHREMFPVGMGGVLQKKTLAGYASVEYDYSGRYAIKYDCLKVELPDTVSVHGLAYDEATRRFYFIGLSDGGMWIGSTLTNAKDMENHIHNGGQKFDVVTKPGYSTISGLRAHDGKLYYHSIASGKDEAHIYDLASGREHRITTSKYGSFDPSPIGSDRVLLTTYTPRGYVLSVQSEKAHREEMSWAKIPRNILNPPRVKWDVVNIDSITVADTISVGVRKYRKGTHLFQFHSWAPAHYKPDEVISESNLSVSAGVSLLSQNLLNSMFTTLGYKYTDEGSLFTAGINYYGLAPKFEFEAEYGTMDQLFYRPANVSLPGKMNFSNRFNLTARVFLPLLLSSGYHVRWLTPMVEFEHDNAKLYYPPGAQQPPTLPQIPKFRNGLQKLIFTLQYTDNVRMAYRDFLPRWGYTLRVRHTMSPLNDNFGKIWTGYGRVYVPGVAKHHSLMLRGAVQKQSAAYYGFRQKELFPRGANYLFIPDRYASMSADYQLPLWYPDGGIESILYFKRIRTNLFGDYARMRDFRGNWKNVTSYGLDLIFDIVPLRLPPNTNTSITISIRKPSDRKGVTFAASLSMPI